MKLADQANERSIVVTPTSHSRPAGSAFAGKPIGVSAHAIIRFAERYLDSSCVAALRQQHENHDDKVLASLRATAYAEPLGRFECAVREAMARRRAQSGATNLSASVDVSVAGFFAVVVIENNVAVTTMPKGRTGAPHCWLPPRRPRAHHRAPRLAAAPRVTIADQLRWKAEAHK